MIVRKLDNVEIEQKKKRGRPKGSKNKIQKILIPKSRNVGIQLGTSAITEKSSKIDRVVSTATIAVYNKYHSLYPDLVWKKKLAREDVVLSKTACQPDGGILFYRGKPIFATEAKFQDKPANAIERWHKNHSLLRLLNPTITYITFASGLQATEHGAISLALDFMHLGEPNREHLYYNSIFYSVDGFTFDTIFMIVDRMLVATIEGIHNNETFIYVGRWQNKINQALSAIYAKKNNYIL